jgi:hypothetical protein
LAVAATVLEYGGDEDIAIAALLHDSVEDQGGKARLEDVRNRFGERVARVVEACSDSLADTAGGERKARWQERKNEYLAHLLKADEDVLRVSLADKVHNARAILRDLRKPEIGAKIWARFSQPKERTMWYYRSLADRFCERLPGQLSNELIELVQVLEASPIDTSAIRGAAQDMTSASLNSTLHSTALASMDTLPTRKSRTHNSRPQAV